MEEYSMINAYSTYGKIFQDKCLQYMEECEMKVREHFLKYMCKTFYVRDIWKNVSRDLCKTTGGLVAWSAMSITDMLGHQDVRGLSAIDPCPWQWISICTMPKDVGILL